MTKHADTAALVAQARKLIAPPRNMSKRMAAESVGLAESTFRYHLAKTAESGGDTPTTQAEEPSRVEPGPDGTRIASSSPTKGRVPTADDVLEEHGMVPDEWVVVRQRVNRWGNVDDPNFQLRVDVVPAESLLRIPDPAGWEKPDLGCIADFTDGSVLFRSDPHLPYNNEALNRAALRFIASEGPSLIVLLGDLADFSIISRHRTHDRFGALVNHTNDAVVRYLWETRQAAPDAEIVLLPGNHDARLLYALQDYKPELYKTRPGAMPGDDDLPDDSLGFKKLWRLDELGIKLVDEDWKLASFAVAPELTARHGYLTGNNSERKLLETHGRSQVHGHDHRGSIIYRTKHDPLDIRVAMSAGTEAEVAPDGLGYQPDPDWTPGVGLGYVWDDGDFAVSFAPFINNNLLLPWGCRISGDEKEDA